MGAAASGAWPQGPQRSPCRGLIPAACQGRPWHLEQSVFPVLSGMVVRTPGCGWTGPLSLSVPVSKGYSGAPGNAADLVSTEVRTSVSLGVSSTGTPGGRPGPCPGIRRQLCGSSQRPGPGGEALPGLDPSHEQQGRPLVGEVMGGLGMFVEGPDAPGRVPALGEAWKWLAMVGR